MKRYAIAGLVAAILILAATAFQYWMELKMAEYLEAGVELSRGTRLLIGLAMFWRNFKWFFVPVIFLACLGAAALMGGARKQGELG